MSDKLRMDAYYYGFNSTGNKDIDLILSAVACAGKAFHHTECWNDEVGSHPNFNGNTPVDWIQNAAVHSSFKIKKLEAENAALRAKLEIATEAIKKIVSWCEVSDSFCSNNFENNDCSCIEHEVAKEALSKLESKGGGE